MKNVQINSKLVERGDIFIAIPCSDSELHISEAFSRGAEIVFAEASTDPRTILINDARLLASRLSRFINPNQPEVCVAVTGTNGKSSVAHFLSQIWTYSGLRSANLGTLGLFVDQVKVSPDGLTIPNLTTPDPLTFHKVMSYLRKDGVTHSVFEASSHAIDQKRCHSADLTAAAFTNLASDHLDYHKTREAYLETKLRLFSEILPADKFAVASMDFPEVYRSVSKINKNILSFGFAPENFISADNIEEFSDRLVFDLRCDGRLFKGVEVKFFGDFQVMNILCAVALGIASGVRIDDIVNVLGQVKPLRGRMEHVRSFNGGNVYVDFAHTTEGFKNALTCFKHVCRGRLICVFGCGGDRDKSKRPEMGKIAADLADISIVTDDNPRTERPSAIRQQILASCPGAVEIENRGAAIRYAMSLIQPGDVVAVMGKGHEEYQIYADKIVHFSDHEEISKQLI